MSAIVVFLFYPTDIIDDNFSKVFVSLLSMFFPPSLWVSMRLLRLPLLLGLLLSLSVALLLPVEPEVSELVFVAVDIADVSGPQASVDIAVVFVVLIPACVLVFEVDIPGPPRFFVLPKICSFANSSSSVEIVDKESVHSSTGVRTNYGCGSKLSNVDLR